MPMSTITVAGINPGLVVLGATQQLNYSQEVGTLQINNSFVPTSLISSITNSEIRNNLLSGFRWTHATTNTDTYGSLTLQSFVNGQSYALGSNMMGFSSTGIDIFVPVNLNSQSISGGTWNGNTIAVNHGGTGVTSATAYSVVCGGTTSTGALQSVASVGSSGQVLTSNGAAALPTWQDIPSNVSSLTGTANQVLVNGTSGSATTGVITLTLPQSIATSSTLQFAKLGLGGVASGSTLEVVSLNAQIGFTAGTAAPTQGLAVSGNTTIGASTATSLFNVGSTNQFQINTSGVVTSGTWQGSSVGVQYGGTGRASATAYSVVCGGTTSTGALQSVASVGSSGQVLTSNGAAALPTWQSKVTSLTGTANQVLVNGTSGSATTGVITLTLPQSIATSSTLQFAQLGLGAAPGAALFSVGASNQFQIDSTGAVTAGIWNGTAIGSGANATGSRNTAFGNNVLLVNSLGTDLTGVGYTALLNNTGSYNTAIGSSTLSSNTGGTSNTAVGYSALTTNVSGAGNTAIGANAGLSYSYTNCTFLGAGADASTTGLTNACAIGSSARVGVNNALVLGSGCYIGIGKNSPAYALHIATDNSTVPLLYMASASVPSAPGTAGDGIYSVASGKPTFTSGTASYRGTIVTAQTGTAATVGSATLSGTTGVTVSTTAITASSIVVVTRSNGTGAAPTAGNLGYLSVASIVANTSFKIYSTNASDTYTVNWVIINP